MRIELTILVAPTGVQQGAAATQQQGATASQAATEAIGTAAQEAVDAAREAQQTIRVERDGRIVSVGPEGVIVGTQAPGLAPPIPEVPQGAVIISVGFFIMIAVIVVGLPIARAIARRMDRAPTSARGQGADQQQLRRMEQALEAISVEVERITENQRFVTRLITEGGADGVLQGGRAGQGAAVPRSPGAGR